MTELNTNYAWDIQKLPPNMSRSYDFNSYSEMREFLDDLAALSEQKGFYPNLNFSRTHVKVKIESELKELSIREYTFANEVDALLVQQGREISDGHA